MAGKVQVKRITIPNGSDAGQRDFDVPTFNDKKTVRGFYAIRGGVEANKQPLNMGVKDRTGAFVAELVNIRHFEVGTDVKVSDRFFKEAPMVAGGSVVKVTIDNPAAIPGGAGYNQIIDVVFLLDDEELTSGPATVK
ncbi:MAG: hypothetical protein KF900_13995 [Bacteroidetes bacterium]|nr:hypothetical protein [Bacteroidota bacterium]